MKGNGRRTALVDLYFLRCRAEGKYPNTLHACRETLRLFLRVAQEERFR